MGNNVVVLLGNLCILISITKTTICPFQCQCTTKFFNCSGQKLFQFPVLHEHFERVDMSSNYLEKLPNTLHNVDRLVSLDISHNWIKQIPRSVFQNCQKLRSLDLSNNRIVHLVNMSAASLLSSNDEMELLNLSMNPLKFLGNRSLCSDSLSTLDVSSCAINSFDGQGFLAGLPNISTLILTNNPIKMINTIVSPTLIKLNLSFCQLHVIRPKSFNSMPMLQQLDISHNIHLSSLDRYGPLESKTLVTLNASYCSLMTLNICGFPNLKFVRLRGNLLTELTQLTFEKNPRLEFLDLSHNAISFLDPLTFLGTNSMIALDLSLNMLSGFQSATFYHMRYLAYLNLSRNPLSIIADAPSLNVLDVSFCEIYSLSNADLANLPEITMLNLSNNPIEVIPNKLHAFKLETLDLSFCRLSDLNHVSFEDCPYLNYLHLSGNRLTSSVHISVLHTLPKLLDLSLTNNPWRCDCQDLDFIKLIQFLKGPPKRSTNFNDLKCHSPENVSGLPWETACIKLFHHERNHKSWLALVVSFVAMTCVVAVMMIVKQTCVSETEIQEVTDHESVRVVCDHSLESFYRRRDMTLLPTYDEAVLLPKPAHSKLDRPSSTAETQTTPLVARSNEISSTTNTIRAKQPSLDHFYADAVKEFDSNNKTQLRFNLTVSSASL